MIRRDRSPRCSLQPPCRRGAETIAITSGTVALGDGSQPIPNGTVVMRDGRIVAAGGMRMKLPAERRSSTRRASG